MRGWRYEERGWRKVERGLWVDMRGWRNEKISSRIVKRVQIMDEKLKRFGWC